MDPDKAFDLFQFAWTDRQEMYGRFANGLA